MSAPPSTARFRITNCRVMAWTPWRLRLAAVPVLIAVAILTTPWHRLQFPSWSTVLIWMMIGALWAPSRARLVEGDENGLYVDGRLIAARPRITHARIDHGTSIRVDAGRFRRVTVHADNFGDADGLLTSLALPEERVDLGRIDLSEARSLLRLLLAFLTMLLGAFGAVVVLLFFGAFGAVAAVLASAAVAIALIPKRLGRVVLGHDGLRLATGVLPELNAPRYVPYHLIRTFEDVDATSVSMTLTSGERIPLRFASKSVAANASAAIRAAWDQGKKRGSLAVVPALARGEKSSSEWLRSIRALVRARSGYREQSVTPETLRDVLAEADAPAGVRLAAALALREALGDEARAQLMQNARVTGDAVVERALVRIANGVDDVAAIALLEQADRASRASERT